MNLNWLVGFIEGEGNFGFTVGKRKSYKIGWQISPIFKLGLVRNDRNVLEKIKVFLKSHDIISHSLQDVEPHHTWSKNASEQTHLRITRIKSCQKLAKLIFPLLESKKKKEVKLWLRGIEKIDKGHHLRKKGFLEIMEIVDELHSLRKQRKPVRYNKKFFGKLFI